MRADNAALSAVSDSLGLSAATVDTEYTALNSVLGDSNGGLTKLQSLLVEAKTAGIDRSKIQADITQIQQQMKSTADAATFNGVNWLSTTTATPATVNLVSSYSRVGSYADHRLHQPDQSPTTALYTSSTSGILDTVSSGASVDTIDIGTLTDSAADQATLDGYIAKVTAAIDSVASAAANLGAVKNRISTNTDFVKSLMDSVDRGIGQLVDADMNQEVHPSVGPPGPAAARRSGALDRQQQQPEHPVAVPLSLQNHLGRAALVAKRGPFVCHDAAHRRNFGRCCCGRDHSATSPAQASRATLAATTGWAQPLFRSPKA